MRKITNGAPSTLNLILPEAFLGADDEEKRFAKIHKNMVDYLEKGLLTEYKDSMVYIERTDSTGKVRAGLVGAIDLEMYDYRKGSSSQVRATEATVAERIPARMKIRTGAALEASHIMVLIDGPARSVIEAVGENKESLTELYDFTLMKKGGSIKGYLLGEKEIATVDSALAALGSQKEEPILLYAIGDGNHSLAAAKTYYEKLKSDNPDKDLSNHPARYALAEIVNLHSDALEFEAIHRIVTGVDEKAFICKMTKALGLTENAESATQSFVCIANGEEKQFGITAVQSNLTVGSVQQFIDSYTKENGGSVDYIHGADVVRRLAAEKGSVGIILPDMPKSQLFTTVIKDGTLPRKTFSMGHAEDKRYYLETRKITL
ncbi:MAG: DUF1015 domain-containing protein [Oscillospiraceae bacterium]|nr:DUF1015 domain-containing protein [Oscillospiraceae bacterium]